MRLLLLCFILIIGVCWCKPADTEEEEVVAPPPSVAVGTKKKGLILPLIGSVVSGIKNVLSPGSNTVKTTTPRPTATTRPATFTPPVNPTKAPVITGFECLNRNCSHVLKQATFKSEVCGSDGITYPNIVTLRCYSNRCDRSVQIGKWGPCRTVERKPTTDSSVPEYKDNNGGNGSAGNTGTLDIKCYSDCPRSNSYQPLCGSDRLRYDNMSHFDCANKCGKKITVLRQGGC